MADVLLYTPDEYDPADMFQGLLHGKLLVYVRLLHLKGLSADLGFRHSSKFTLG